MAIPKKVLTLIALVATGVVASGAVAVGTQDHTPSGSADPNNPPPKPAWVNVDGTVDPSKMPGCIKVIGSHGRPVSKGNGEPVCVPRREVVQGPLGPPPENPRAVNARNRALEEERRIVELPKSSPANAWD